MQNNTFIIDVNSLTKNMATIPPKTYQALFMYATTKATQIESKMKINRPWTDRTNMAKIKLKAVASKPDSDIIRITLAHGVDYGIWLELAHEKQYAILLPTLNEEGPKITNDLTGFLSKVGL